MQQHVKAELDALVHLPPTGNIPIGTPVLHIPTGQSGRLVLVHNGMAVLRDLGASLHASGFKKVVLFNTHGGNAALVDVMARDLRAEFGLRMFSLFGSGGAAFTAST